MNSSSVADAATGVAVVDGERIGEKLEKVASDAFAKKIISIAYLSFKKCPSLARRRGGGEEACQIDDGDWFTATITTSK